MMLNKHSVTVKTASLDCIRTMMIWLMVINVEITFFSNSKPFYASQERSLNINIIPQRSFWNGSFLLYMGIPFTSHCSNCWTSICIYDTLGFIQKGHTNTFVVSITKYNKHTTARLQGHIMGLLGVQSMTHAPVCHCSAVCKTVI